MADKARAFKIAMRGSLKAVKSSRQPCFCKKGFGSWGEIYTKHLEKDPNAPKRGSVWGILTWRGVTADKPTKIPGTDKREWHAYNEEYYKRYEDPTKYIQNQHLPGGVQPIPIVIEHTDRLPVLDPRFEVYYPPPVPIPSAQENS